MSTDIIKKSLALLAGRTSNLPKTFIKERPLSSLTERELINLESKIGAQLFGPIKKGHRREFFCLDAKTWVWHEEWLEGKVRKQHTTRYEVHTEGIVKIADGVKPVYLQGEELKNLVLATRMYYEQVARAIYKIDPATGKKIQ